jgi:hypothetical protein
MLLLLLCFKLFSYFNLVWNFIENFNITMGWGFFLGGGGGLTNIVWHYNTSSNELLNPTYEYAYINNKAKTCTQYLLNPSLVNTFPWISSVCWDKWLIFLFSLLYLVYLKHARIVDTCVCKRCFHMFLSIIRHMRSLLKYACK